jgi:hypothetical protein
MTPLKGDPRHHYENRHHTKILDWPQIAAKFLGWPLAVVRVVALLLAIAAILVWKAL